MQDNVQQKHISPINIKPSVFPILGLLFGLLIWIIDAGIDVYILGEEQSLLENVLSPDEASELWMRTLVILVFLIMGFFSKHILQKHILLDKILFDYQEKLEHLVEERTRELQDKTVELEQLANTDALTGLYNRRRFTDILEQELKLFERYNRSFCLINIDIDHFKKVNDTYGHDVGDKVIKQFCNTLTSNIRSSDSACRWGGEEFLLLIFESDETIAIQLATKFTQIFNQKK